MSSFFPRESRWSTLCILESGSELRYVLSTTRATSCREENRNSLWVLRPKGYEKFTPWAGEIGGNRQTAACLITDSLLISLFYLPPWMEAEGLATSNYFPKEAAVCLLCCWFWTKFNIIDLLGNSQAAYFCLSALLCFFSVFGFRLSLVL